MDILTAAALSRWLMTDERLHRAARMFLDAAKAKGLKVATAESCTAGLVAACMGEVPGASWVLERGFVTYSNEAKAEMLGVPAELIATHGAVSAEVARAMAEGALLRSQADLAVAITGIAGPDGGSAEKPVGLVHFAAKRRGRETVHVEKRFGDIGRINVQHESVARAFQMLMELMERQ